VEEPLLQGRVSVSFLALLRFPSLFSFNFFLVTSCWHGLNFAGFYEKDRLVPVDPRRLPQIDDAKLATYPEGYRWLGYLQNRAAGYDIKMDLPQSRGAFPSFLFSRVPSWPLTRLTGADHDSFYESFIKWLDGASIEEMKVDLHVWTDLRKEQFWM
jgi:hypothetical protein